MILLQLNLMNLIDSPIESCRILVSIWCSPLLELESLILMIGELILLIIPIGCFLQWILKAHRLECLIFILRSLSTPRRRTIEPASFISVKPSEIQVVEFLKSGEFEIWVESSIYLSIIYWIKRFTDIIYYILLKYQSGSRSYVKYLAGGILLGASMLLAYNLFFR